MPRQRSTTANGLRQLLLSEHKRSLKRWRVPGRRDELEHALASGAPVEVSAAMLLKALMSVGLPHDHVAYGGTDFGKVFVLDERDRLVDVAS